MLKLHLNKNNEMVPEPALKMSTGYVNREIIHCKVTSVLNYILTWKKTKENCTRAFERVEYIYSTVYGNATYAAI